MDSSPRQARLRRAAAPAALLLLVAAAFWAFAAWAPGPPRTVTIATGPEGSAYATYGARYQAALARSGVEVRLRATAGAVENLAQLRDPAAGVAIAFAQAGTAAAEDAEALVSLGTVFYEPLWIFHRGLDVGRGISALRGKRMSIGPEGSGTRELALRTLRFGGVDSGSADLRGLDPAEAAESLKRGEIDIAAIVTSWDSPVVHELLTAPGVELAGFPRADAHLALNPYLSKLVLPAGVADMGRNIPPADVVLVAPKASLVVRRDLHPALRYLLLEAAVEIHSRPGVFQRAAEFPALEAIDLPLAEEAREFSRSGRPFLQRYLPFRLAAVAERLLVLLVPLVGALYPVLRSAPAVYAWTVRRRVFRLYGELKLVELEMEEGRSAGTEDALLARLDDLEERAARLRVSKGHAALVYTLRHHIRLIRERLSSRPAPPTPAAGGRTR